MRKRNQISILALVFCVGLVIAHPAHADTETLRPNGAGTYQEFETLVGTSHWEATNDESDTTYIETGTEGNRDIQALADPTFGDGATINSVTIYVRAQASGSAGPERIMYFDRLGTTDRTDGNQAVSRTAFTDYSATHNVNPDGDPWTKTDISNLEVGATVSTIGGGETMQISEIWIVVDYTPFVNTPPVASATLLDSGAASVNLTENTTTSVTCTATVTDDDGFADIDYVQAEFYRTGVGAGAPDDNNNHYTRSGDAQCVPSNGSGTTEDYICTFDVWYYADPTDAGPHVSNKWECLITPYDTAGVGTTDTDDLEMNGLAALDVTSSISYGSLALGANTGSSNKTTTITNTGNVAIDVQFFGSNMGCTFGSIPVGNQRYGTTDVVFTSLFYALSGAATERDLDILQRTDDATPSTKLIYWGLQIPSQGVGGNCGGSNTFTAVNDINLD